MRGACAGWEARAKKMKITSPRGRDFLTAELMPIWKTINVTWKAQSLHKEQNTWLEIMGIWLVDYARITSPVVKSAAWQYQDWGTLNFSKCCKCLLTDKTLGYGDLERPAKAHEKSGGDWWQSAGPLTKGKSCLTKLVAFYDSNDR